MEDFGNIIFYVIAAIIGIAGTLRKKRRKNAASEGGMFGTNRENTKAERFPYIRQSPVSGDDHSEEDPWSEIAATEANTASESVIKDNPLIMNASLEGNYVEPLAAEFADEGASVYSAFGADYDFGTQEIPEIIEEDSLASELARDFDLPKAIIYSEILKRKDFV